jgi:hypothetical protein
MRVQRTAMRRVSWFVIIVSFDAEWLLPNIAERLSLIADGLCRDQIWQASCLTGVNGGQSIAGFRKARGWHLRSCGSLRVPIAAENTCLSWTR